MSATTLNTSTEPKYADKWDSEHFYFQAISKADATANSILDENVIKIFKVLKGSCRDCETPSLGKFTMSATGEKLAELADKIDSLLGENHMIIMATNPTVSESSYHFCLEIFHSKKPCVDMPYQVFWYVMMDQLHRSDVRTLGIPKVGTFNLDLIKLKA